MPSLGEAYIEVHADTGPFDRELAASIEGALIKAEAAMRSRGRDSGNAFSQGVETAVRDRTKRIGDNLANDLVHSAEDAGKIVAKDLGTVLDDVLTLNPNVNESGLNKSRSRITQWASSIGSAVQSGFTEATTAFSALQGAFSQFSNVNVLFNPAVLAGAFGIVGGAILGLTQLLYPLGAFFLAFPAALSSVGAELFVITAAFDGLSKAIKGAFLAKNQSDLNAALQGLHGAAKDFVADFYVVGQLWRQIVEVAQNKFFTPMRGVLDAIVKSLGGPLLSGVAKLADSLGFSLGLVGTVLAGPAMRRLVSDLFPAIANIVDKLTGPFVELLTSLLGLIDASLPFLSGLADVLGGIFKSLADWLSGAVKDGSLKKFFADALVTIKIVLISLGEIWDFISVILAAVNKNGSGNNFLLSIGTAFETMAKFFSSDFGQQAIDSMITAAEGAVVIIGGLIIALTSVWQVMILAFQSVGAFFSWLWHDVLVPLGEALGSIIVSLATGFADLWQRWLDTGKNAWAAMQTGLQSVADWISGRFNTVKADIIGAWNATISFFASIPDRIKGAIGDLGGLLYQAGRNIITGLVNGIENAIPGLKSTLNWITSQLPDWKGPEDKDKKILMPAGNALMQGLRAGIATGAAGVYSDLQAITGLIGVNANANSFNFGPGAITQNFNGAQPSAVEAQALGSAVGAGISHTVNSQNIRAGTRAL